MHINTYQIIYTDIKYIGRNIIMSWHKRNHIQIYVFKLQSLHNVFATYHNVALSCRLPRPALVYPNPQASHAWASVPFHRLRRPLSVLKLWSSAVSSSQVVASMFFSEKVMLMEEIRNNHLECMKPCKNNGIFTYIYHINWCRISDINRIFIYIISSIMICYSDLFGATVQHCLPNSWLSAIWERTW